MNHAGIPRARRERLAHRMALLLPLLLIAGYLIAGSGGDPDRNRIAVRYLLFAWSGLIAFVIPYISFPDPKARLSQLGNLPSAGLLKLYLGHHRLLLLVGLIILLLTAPPNSGDIQGSVTLLLYGFLFMAGIWLYSASRYIQTGHASQQWQESERGHRVSVRMAAVAKYPVDAGSIPSLVTSVAVSLFGMLGVVLGALAFQQAGVAGELVWSVLVFLFGLQRTLRLRRASDRYFYQTNAFFSEFFGNLKRGPGGPQPVAVEQLWWIPARWKVHSWALILQMDRKLPAGRFIAGGHLFLWILAYRGLDGELLVAFWLIFALLHQSFLLLTTDRELVPVWWLRLLDPTIHWVLTRFWVQVRWLLPLAAGMAVMMWLFPLYGWSEIGLVVGVYLLSAVVAAVACGWFYERYGRINGI